MGQETYDLAVVFDDLQSHFDDAVRDLTALHDKLSKGPLKEVDLVFLRPSTLICRLGFDAGMVGVGKLAKKLSVAQTRYFRVLDLMSIATTNGTAIYKAQLESAQWKAAPSTNLAADLETLRSILGTRAGGDDRRDNDRAELTIPVHFQGGPEPAVGLAKNISSDGMYVESDVIPAEGTELRLSLEPLFGSDLKALPVTVMHTLTHDRARRHGRVPGFGVKLALNDTQRALFESFLVAAVRGRPWPEQSGRKHARFPIKLPIEIWAGDEAVRAETRDLSRGGLYVATDILLPPGSFTEVTLFGYENGVGVGFDVKVTHAVHHGEAKRRGVDVGMGMEFQESPEVLNTKFGVVLGSVELPAAYRALVVDDDTFFSNVFATTLRQGGYKVYQAASAEDAYRTLLEELFRFDLVVIDAHLPGSGWYDLVEWISQVDGYADMAIAMTTTKMPKQDELEKWVGAGIREVLDKQSPPEHLLKLVDKLLETTARLDGADAPQTP